MQTERQKEIVEVALKLISEKGIQGFTIKNLAKEIGITEPAIYRHFDNKIHILITILDFFKKNTQLILEKELKSEGKAFDKIEHLLAKHFSAFSASPSLVSVIFAEEIFRNEPVLIAKVSDIIENTDDVFCKIISEGQNNGEIRNDIEAKFIAIVIMGTLRLFVKKWQFSKNSFNLESEGKKLIESVRLLIIK